MLPELLEFKQNYKSSKEILQTNLQYYRKQRGLSQSKLSMKACLQRSYLSELENGKRNPTISNVYRLSLGFHMEPWHLLKPITYNEWTYGKECSFTPYDLTANTSRLLTSEDYFKILIEHIRYLRKKQNWFQRDLAQFSGLSEIFIRYVELGKKEPTLESLDKISIAFDIKTWQLIKGIDMNSIWLENDMWL